MKNIGILYICTGKYSIFWKNFYISMEKSFMVDCEKHYYVFTDDKDIYDADKNERVHVIYQQQLPWPLATLLRFHIFNAHKDLYKNDDYLFFLNANLEVVNEVKFDIIDQNKKIIFVNHPGWYKRKMIFTPHDNNKKSTAYVPLKDRKIYVQGAFIGGKKKDFLKMSEELENNINIDLKKNVIAKWHDESHINKYLLTNKKDIQILLPEYLYPEEGYKNLKNLEPKIIIKDKNKFGGHNFLRSTNSAKN